MSVRTVVAVQGECPYALDQPDGGLMRCTFGWAHAGPHSWEAVNGRCTASSRVLPGPMCGMEEGHAGPHSWENQQQADPINHPQHYQSNGLEAIDIIEAFGLGFNLGNTVKYILRAGRKGQALEDLKKARWYLEREIGRLEPTAQTSGRTKGASGKQSKERE